MLRRYKNVLFEDVRARGLDPSLIYPADGMDGYPNMGPHDFCLTLKGTDLQFEFTQDDTDSDAFHFRYTSIGGGATRSYTDLMHSVPFETARTAFRRWLSKEVQPYLEDQSLPDLWANKPADSTIAAFQPAESSENTLFSIEERTRLAASLHGLEGAVAEQGLLNAEQLRVLSAKVEQLIDAGNRLGRKDWIQMALGAFASLALEGVLRSEVFHKVLELASQALDWISRQPRLIP